MDSSNRVTFGIGVVIIPVLTFFALRLVLGVLNLIGQIAGTLWDWDGSFCYDCWMIDFDGWPEWGDFWWFYLITLVLSAILVGFWYGYLEDN